jgi:hypothetical protein
MECRGPDYLALVRMFSAELNGGKLNVIASRRICPLSVQTSRLVTAFRAKAHQEVVVQQNIKHRPAAWVERSFRSLIEEVNMDINDTPLGQIKPADLQALVDNRVVENRRLDYKETLPGSTDEERKKFLADVDAMADASGGDIYYGI